MISKNTQVLLIDDDPFTMEITKTVVKTFVKNHQIKTFGCAREALRHLLRESDVSEDENPVPGIILSDLHMPGMDGFQFLEEFTKLTEAAQSRYRVFILSSTSDEQERARLLEKVCVEGFCPKPLTPEKFMGLMEQVIISM